MEQLITKKNWDIIHKILLDKWDPIGIREFHNAKDDDDEYDHYINELYSILISKNALNNTVEYLWFLENEHIGLPGSIEHTKKIAQLLLDSIEI